MSLKWLIYSTENYMTSQQGFKWNQCKNSDFLIHLNLLKFIYVSQSWVYLSENILTAYFTSSYRQVAQRKTFVPKSCVGVPIHLDPTLSARNVFKQKRLLNTSVG